MICDWTDNMRYLFHCRMLKIHVRRGIVLDKVHEIMLFKQSMWLEKYIIFYTQKINQAVYDFEKDFHNILNNAF